jgi:ubiquitin carboxyl-terminal hydrolase 2/21
MHLKGIYQNEEKIKNLIKKPLGNITQPKKYYLVNNDWFKNYKKIYKYNYYLNILENSDEKLICNLKIQNIPKEFKDNHTLEANTTKILNKYEAPIDFQLIDKNIFDKILKDINDKNNPQIQSDMVYPISFGGDKIFIDINNIYFIFSSKQQNYKLEYIFELKNDNIKNFCSNCENNENFEKFMAKYDIDFSSKNEQNIINDNLDIIGNFVNIEQKNWVKIDKPNHCLGLENIGATCYMNATIQCLCNVFNLKKKFQDKNLMYKYINKGDCPLTKEFYKLVNNLWKYPKKKNYYTPTDFKNCISKMNPLFKGIAANDSKDLIIFIYETIHAEINKQRSYNIDINDNQELALFRKDYYSKNCSFLIDIFYFEQQSELTCLNCNYTKISYNIANIIIFPLEKVREYMIKKSPHGFISVTLDNCFENYQEAELLNGENQIYCNNCYRMSNATTGNKIFTSPEVMTIILNRGKGLEFDVNFEYPIHLNVDKYVMDKTCKNNNYELIAVLSHIGPSGMSGHFIAFCRSPEDNRWYIYNDAQVTECYDPRYHNDDMIEGLPYVLFYQKIDVNKKNNNSQDNNVDDIYMNDENENYIEDPNQITLFFKYDDKEFYLDTNKDNRIRDLIKELNRRYGIPKDSSLYLEGDNELSLLEYYNKISQYPKIKNNSKIVVVKN